MYLVETHRLSIVRACAIVRFSRAAWYKTPADPLITDAPVIAALQAVIKQHPRHGFWKCYDRICGKSKSTESVRRANSGKGWNHKRVYRVYCALKLNLPRRTKRRLPTRVRQPLDAPAVLNKVWALDFMSDALYRGRKFRTLNVIDEGNREGLAVDAAYSIPSARVVRILDELVAMNGKPEALRMDNGPEFIAEALTRWCEEQGIAMRFIQPGKPDQNAYIERFNRSYRQEVLDAYLFSSIEEVRAITDEWLEDYNTERPHDSLGRVPPRTFLPRFDHTRESSFELST
jgi:putative transposase